ncbi:hypothetical protein ID866_9475, partial [Astraeus odoratus]
CRDTAESATVQRDLTINLIFHCTHRINDVELPTTNNMCALANSRGVFPATKIICLGQYNAKRRHWRRTKLNI